MESPSDHDILIRVQQDLRWLMTAMSNHIQHHEADVKYHRAITVCAIGAMLAAFTAVGLAWCQGLG